MKNWQYVNLVTNLALENSSSHIYLLKSKFNHYIEDFVEGFNIWEKKKSELIIDMAEILEKLHFLGEYDEPLDTISSHIRHILREKGVSDYNLDYVNRVLPSKYKNENLARESSSTNSNNNSNNNNEDGMNIHADSSSSKIVVTTKPVNIYELKKELENLSETEFQNYALNVEEEDKFTRNNMKARKDLIEYVAIKKQYETYEYDKTSSDVPPPHLHRETVLQERFERLAKEALDMHKYFKDLAKSIHEFPPESDERAQRLANKIDTFINGPWNVIKYIFIAPTTDKKWSGDWVKWCDIQLTHLEHSKNYAGSKHALETGKFAVKYKDGSEQVFSLDRGITREQVGDKLPELLEMCKELLIGYPMVNALHDWSYNTFIDEEYDENGNPIIMKK